ncbi:MAG: hypothetical protein PHE29_07040 [Tissierellia bacterium]|nr:hypothetical protein [Tissierellia bacterium]
MKKLFKKIDKKTDDIIFNIVVIMVLLVPMIYCFNTAKEKAYPIQPQKNVIYILKDLAHTNSNYRYQLEEKTKELNETYAVVYGNYTIVFLVGVIILYLSYKTFKVGYKKQR